MGERKKEREAWVRAFRYSDMETAGAAYQKARHVISFSATTSTLASIESCSLAFLMSWFSEKANRQLPCDANSRRPAHMVA